MSAQATLLLPTNEHPGKREKGNCSLMQKSSIIFSPSLTERGKAAVISGDKRMMGNCARVGSPRQKKVSSSPELRSDGISPLLKPSRESNWSEESVLPFPPFNSEREEKGEKPLCTVPQDFDEVVES